MGAVTISLQKRKLTHRIFTPIRAFLVDSRAVGIILIACTIFSLTLSNLLATKSAYNSFWQHTVHITFAGLHLPESYLLWINDVFMTFFFFLVGMEIKRELIAGELATIKKSLLPVLAALGGMIVPAIIFTLFNGDTVHSHGWGIPMATDIAFSLGVLSLLGKKVPVSLKIFLAALAIIDDLGAVITIGIFYTDSLNTTYLLYGLGMLAVVLLLNRLNIIKPVWYLLPGIVLWYCIFNSGVHATIAGVLMAFSMPLNSLAKLERVLYRPVNFVIMPLFALANTAILLPVDFIQAYSSTISIGVMTGLVLGKPVGIFLFSFVATKLKIASLPSHTNYAQLWGIGILGGIGFTMSIFTSTLAYNTEALQVISKVSIISASVIAAIAGHTWFRRVIPAATTTMIAYKEIAENREEEEISLAIS
jgi:NhaA family Na+:H+ antiporter